MGHKYLFKKMPLLLYSINKKTKIHLNTFNGNKVLDQQSTFTFMVTFHLNNE